jgi:hypothetical protein
MGASQRLPPMVTSSTSGIGDRTSDLGEACSGKGRGGMQTGVADGCRSGEGCCLILVDLLTTHHQKRARGACLFSPGRSTFDEGHVPGRVG